MLDNLACAWTAACASAAELADEGVAAGSSAGAADAGAEAAGLADATGAEDAGPCPVPQPANSSAMPTATATASPRIVPKCPAEAGSLRLESKVIMRPTCVRKERDWVPRSMHESFHPRGHDPAQAKLAHGPSAGCDRVHSKGSTGSAGPTTRRPPGKRKAPAEPGPTSCGLPASPRWAPRGRQACDYGVEDNVKRLLRCLLLRLLRTLGLAGARRLGHHGLLRGALARGLLGSAFACRLLRCFLRSLPHRLACRGGLRLGGLAHSLLGRLLGGFACSFLGSHGSSQLLISWQWLPSERMQKRLAQKIAVRGVPQVGHLTTRTLVGKQPEYMQRNRDGDLPNLLGFGTVLDVRLYVLGSRHVSVLRHVVGRKASPAQTWCQSIFCDK